MAIAWLFRRCNKYLCCTLLLSTIPQVLILLSQQIKSQVLADKTTIITFDIVNTMDFIYRVKRLNIARYYHEKSLCRLFVLTDIDT